MICCLCLRSPHSPSTPPSVEGGDRAAAAGVGPLFCLLQSPCLEQGPLHSCFLNLGMRMYRPPLPHIACKCSNSPPLHAKGGGESAHSRIPKFRKQVRKRTFSL